MPDQRAEVGYRVTVEGAGELKDLAAQQRAVRQSTVETNELFKVNDASMREAAAGAGIYAKEQEALRRSQFKQGASYDPQLIEEARIKSVAQAHRELDAQIERGQLKQLTGLERIHAEHRKINSELAALNDPALLTKTEQIFGAKRTAFIEAEREAATAAAFRAQQRAKQEAEQLVLSQASGLRGLATASSGGSLATVGSGIASSFGTAGIAIAGVILALGAAAVAATALVASSGQLAESVSNTADRLGLTTGAVLKLKAAGDIAGVSIETLEAAGRTLGNALEDPAGAGKKAAEELGKLGISAYDAKGNVRELGPVILEVLTALSKIPNTTDRVAASVRLLPRGAAIGLQPLIKDYEALQRAVADLGIGLDENLIPSLAKGNDEFDKLHVAFGQLKLELADAIQPIVIPIIIKIKDLIRGDKRTDDQVLADEANGLVPRLGRVIQGALGIDVPPLELDQAELDQAAKRGQPSQDPKKPNTDALRNQQAAARYRFKRGDTLEGLEAEKQQLEKAIRESDSKLRLDTFPAAGRPPLEAQQTRDTTELHAVEAKIKELREHEGELKKLKAEVEAIEKRSAEFELSGLARINVQRDEEIKKIRASHVALADKEALIKRVTAAADEESKRETNKEAAARLRAELALRQQIIELELGPGKELEAIHARADLARETAQQAFAIDKNREFRDKAFDAADTREAADVTIFHTKNRLADDANVLAVKRLGIEQQLSLAEKRVNFNPTGTFNETDQEERAQRVRELRKAAIEEEYQLDLKGGEAGEAARKRELAIAREQGEYDSAILAAREAGEQNIIHLREQAIQTQAGRSIRLLELDSDSSEFSNVEKIRDIRVKAALDEYAIKKNGAQLQRDLDQAEFERVQSILELRKKELDQFKSEAGSLFDALSSQGSRGLSTFLAGFTKTIEKKLFENVAGLAFEGIRDKVPKIGGQEDAQGHLTVLGKILEGTPFGKGASNAQLKAAEDALAATKIQVSATSDNTKALQALSGVLARARGEEAGTVPGSGVSGIEAATKANTQAEEDAATLEEQGISASPEPVLHTSQARTGAVAGIESALGRVGTEAASLFKGIFGIFLPKAPPYPIPINPGVTPGTTPPFLPPGTATAPDLVPATRQQTIATGANTHALEAVRVVLGIANREAGIGNLINAASLAAKLGGLGNPKKPTKPKLPASETKPPVLIERPPLHPPAASPLPEVIGAEAKQRTQIERPPLAETLAALDLQKKTIEVVKLATQAITENTRALIESAHMEALADDLNTLALLANTDALNARAKALADNTNALNALNATLKACKMCKDSVAACCPSKPAAPTPAAAPCVCPPSKPGTPTPAPAPTPKVDSVFIPGAPVETPTVDSTFTPGEPVPDNPTTSVDSTFIPTSGPYPSSDTSVDSSFLPGAFPGLFDLQDLFPIASFGPSPGSFGDGLTPVVTSTLGGANGEGLSGAGGPDVTAIFDSLFDAATAANGGPTQFNDPITQSSWNGGYGNPWGEFGSGSAFGNIDNPDLDALNAFWSGLTFATPMTAGFAPVNAAAAQASSDAATLIDTTATKGARITLSPPSGTLDAASAVSPAQTPPTTLSTTPVSITDLVMPAPISDLLTSAPASSFVDPATGLPPSSGIPAATSTTAGIPASLPDLGGTASSAFGGLTSLSSVLGTLGTAAALGALVTSFIKMLLGDPRAARDRQIKQEIQDNAYQEKQGVNVVQDSATGNMVDSDYLGNVRNLGVKPQIELLTRPIGFDQVPPQLSFLQQLGFGSPPLPGLIYGGAQQRLAPDVRATSQLPQPVPYPTPAAFASPTPTPNVIVNFNATIPVTGFDAKSIVDQSGAIGDAITAALQNGHRLRNDILRVVRP